MQQKIVIIGASSGMGKRLAELYAGRGERVGITGRRRELMEGIRQQYPQLIEIETFDITGTENKLHLEKLIEKLGGLDILIISAGMGEPSDDLLWEIDQPTIATNVYGFTEIANWAFNYFIERGHGTLAAITSIAANRSSPPAPAYAASKAFQASYLEALTIKARKTKKDVHVVCIQPGFIDTKMAKSKRIFWLVPLEKAARQIIRAIDKKKTKVYISKRWRLIAFLMKWTPHWIYKRIA